MKRLLILLFIFFSQLTCVAQFEQRIVNSRGNALGKTFATLDDFWSAIKNQAGLIQQKKVKAGMAISNEFLLQELSSKTLGCAVPFPKIGVFGMSYNHFGHTEYSEQTIGLAFAKGFGSKFSAGIQFDYLLSDINYSEYKNESFFTFECGLQYLLSKSIQFGFHVFNPISIKRNSYQDEHIAAILQMGVRYAFNDELLCVAEIEKNIQQKECLNLGLEYKIVSTICLRAGLSTYPVTYAFGIGINIKQWEFDISSTLHSVLGVSPQLSVTYSF